MKITRRQTLAALGTVATTGCVDRVPGIGGRGESPDEPWSQYRGDAGNTGQMPENAGPGRNADATMLRTMENSSSSQPVVRDDRIYAAIDKGTYIYDLEGNFVDNLLFPAAVKTPPAIGEKKIFMAAGESIVTYTIEDGESAWHRFFDERFLQNPTLFDDTVYIGNTDGSVYALDAADGTELKHATVGPDVDDTGPYVEPLAVDEAHIYAGTDGQLDVLDRESGDLVWQKQGLDTDVIPIAGQEFAYAGADAAITAFDKTDGTVEWQFDPDRAKTGTPAVGESSLYCTVYGEDDADAVTAIDRQTGTEQWRTQIPAWGSTPVIAGDTLYVSVEGRVRALDANTGSVRFSLSPYGDMVKPVAIAEGGAYVVSILHEGSFIEMFR